MDEPQKQNLHPHHHFHVSGLLVVVLILCVILAILIKPSIDNFNLSKKFANFGSTPEEIIAKVEQVEKQQDLLLANLSAMDVAAKTLTAENAQLRMQVLDLNTNYTRLQGDMVFVQNEYTYNLSKLNETYSQKYLVFLQTLEQDKEKAAQAIVDFAELHASSGRSICCREKVDSPSIDSYNVVNNKIVCGSDGDYKVSC